MKLAVLFLLGSAIAMAQSRPAVAKMAGTCLAGVDLVTVLSITEVESHYQPWALNVNYPEHLARQWGYASGLITLGRQPHSYSEAVNWINWFAEHGVTLSVGLMQVNTVDAGKLGISAEQLLDPCTNLKTGWRVLEKHYRRAERRYGAGQRALRAAISAYNSGSFTAGFESGYVRKVLLAALAH